MGLPSEGLIIDALDALEKGESVETILAAHSAEEMDLRAVLETAERLAHVRIAHSLESQSNSKQKFLEGAEALRTGSERPKVLAGFFRRFALSAVPLAMMLVIIVSGVIFASRSAVPGAILYGAKRAAEDLRFAITVDPEAKQSLRSEIERERILEINALLDEGKTAEVEFSGIIEVIGENTWIISGLRVSLDSETAIDGEPRIGYRALVQGEVAAGRLTAREIAITGSGLSLPEPTPDEQNIDPVDEVDPLPMDTPTRTPQPSPTPSETPSPTITLLPTPSPEPSQTSAALPTPDDSPEDDEPEGGDDLESGDDSTEGGSDDSEATDEEPDGGDDEPGGGSD